MKYTHLVIWQHDADGHKAGDVVSRHTSLLEAEHKATQHWAWGLLDVAGDYLGKVIGDRVVDRQGIEGTIQDISDDMALVEWDNGERSSVPLRSLKSAEGWDE